MEKDGLGFTLSIKDDFPEVEAAVRKVLADMLRERAEDGPISADELRELAAMLEAGQ